MTRLTQNSFLGGQLDYEMLGRQDIQKYGKGATKLLNFNIQKRGGLEKRAGFDRVVNLKKSLNIDASTKVRLIPYAYKKTQGFVLLVVPLKMYVIGTAPDSTYKIYNVSDCDNIYSSDEIDSIDYQQCGDVIFIAHQNHPPAKIEHVIDDLGEHGFHYEVLDFLKQKEGVPTIEGATVTRTAVNSTGATYTEEYKVSAVFDGVETFPCNAFKDTNVVNNTSTWNGTTYYLPWTESQKISLTITPQYRLKDDGVTKEYPSEIRVYKKAFNYFGLIGVIKLDMNDVQKELSSDTEFIETYQNSDIDTPTSIFDVDADETIRGDGMTSVKATSLTATISGWESTDGGRLALGLGSVYYTVGEGSVVLTYKACTAEEIVVTFGENTNTITMPQTQGDKTETITQGSGESDDAFATRWRDAYAVFKNSIIDTTNISVTLPTTDGTEITITPSSGNMVLNSVKVFRDATISSVTFDDKYITPSTDNTPPEYNDDSDIFVGEGNYPAAVSLSQQRLVWASTKNDPARIWLSQTGDFYTYYSHEIQTPDDAIDFIMPVTRFAKINHIAEMRRLLMFNSACEWLVDSASSNSGITYETIQAHPQSYSGSSERLKPIICNNSLVFCERTGQSVRRFAYDLSNDGFAGRDVSILASSIFENNNIVDWTYQQFPFSTLWCVLADGTMASFEFMEEQDIIAWAKHEHGSGGAFKAVATTYAVAPALDEISDTDAYENATQEEIYAVVVVGSEVWLERMRVRSKPTDSVYHSLCLDSLRVLNANNSTMIEDDNLVYIPQNTTTGETITRDEASEVIEDGGVVYEGYPFTSKYISVFPVFHSLGDTIGSGQIDIKNICNIALRLSPSYGGTISSYNYGVEGENKEAIRYDDVPENDCSPVFGNGTVTLKECDCPNIKPEGMNTRDGRVVIEQSAPWAFGLLMYQIDIETENGGWYGR